MTTNPLTYSTTAMVREFHTAVGAPINTGEPTLDIGDRLHLRMALIGEEFAELIDAVYGKSAGDVIRADLDHIKAELDDNERDVVGAADALADLDYVICGMAIETGIPHPDVVTEVHRSNMSKLGEDGLPILREDGKVLKGDNYSPPDVASVLDVQLVPA